MIHMIGLEVAAVLVLGLAAGAVAAEGAVLVPVWRSMPAQEFLAWYRKHGGLLLRFFGPLEAVAAAASVAALAKSWGSDTSAAMLWTLAAGSSLAVLAAFPLYFQRVNASFTAATIATAAVPDELRRWAAWHWVRVALAVLAFLAAALALAAS
jgi:hypothetical protein